jgi:muramoyltetrapeptide carboxypeptidase
MKTPCGLKKGDKIGIIAPARKISAEDVYPATEIIKQHGFDPVYGTNLFAQYNQFAGNDKIRVSDFQEMLDNPEIKAVVSVRGGYGTVRVVDNLNFNNFVKNPKWLAGYSDFTVVLNHVFENYNIQTLHATMPINFTQNTQESLNKFFDILNGKKTNYEWKQHPLNKRGKVSGVLVGGNLSVLYSLIGSKSFPDTTGKILFIEDLDEYLYHIDRMMTALKRAGKLKNLKALLIGSMTDMNDNNIAFGKTAEEIIFDTVKDYNYPVAMGFQAGHINNNLPLVIGGFYKMEINENSNLKLIK